MIRRNKGEKCQTTAAFLCLFAPLKQFQRFYFLHSNPFHQSLIYLSKPTFSTSQMPVAPFFSAKNVPSNLTANSDVSAVSVDLLIFAPHPDDETLGCGGVIMQALAAGKRIHVVIFTNGDGYTKATSMLVNKNIDKLLPGDYLELSRVRQLEVYAATKKLGLKPSDITFLGYPDGGLNMVYQTGGSNYYSQSPTTLKRDVRNCATRLSLVRLRQTSTLPEGICSLRHDGPHSDPTAKRHLCH